MYFTLIKLLIMAGLLSFAPGKQPKPGVPPPRCPIMKNQNCGK